MLKTFSSFYGSCDHFFFFQDSLMNDSVSFS